VRARQIPQSATCAEDVHTFWPCSRHPPSTRTARVESAARSDPAPGSLNSWHQTISPRSVGGTKRSRCWSVAVGQDRRQGPLADHQDRLLDPGPAPNSSAMTTCSAGVRRDPVRAWVVLG